MESVKLGKITAPVGIKGEVRVFAYTDELTRFSDITNLDVDNKAYDVENVRYHKNMVVLKLSGVNTRNEAEALRDKELSLKKEFLWDIPEDTYFVKDLIGIQVHSKEGNFVGVISDVIKNSAQDLYQITTQEGHSFLIPAVKEFIINVDIEKKEMIVHLIEGLTEL